MRALLADAFSWNSRGTSDKTPVWDSLKPQFSDSSAREVLYIFSAADIANSSVSLGPGGTKDNRIYHMTG
jgi:hypothetical protein